jgi:general secretion pathway protein D
VIAALMLAGSVWAQTPEVPPSAAESPPPTVAVPAPEWPRATEPAPVSPYLPLPAAASGRTIGPLDLRGADIDTFLKLLSTTAQVTIVKPPEVQGPITLIMPQSMPVEEAFYVLNALLAVRNYTSITVGGMVIIQPLATATRGPVPVEFGRDPAAVPAQSRIITQVIPLRNVAAGDAQILVQGMSPPEAVILATPATNSLIVTDTAANIHRVLTVLGDWEKRRENSTRVFPLRYVMASDAATILNQLLITAPTTGAVPRPFEQAVVGGPPGTAAIIRAMQTGAAAQTGAGVQIIPIAWSNSLMVIGDQASLQRAEEMIKALNVPTEYAPTWFTYQVQNTSAASLAATITAFFAGQSGLPPTSTATRTTTGTSTRTATPSSLLGTGTGTRTVSPLGTNPRGPVVGKATPEGTAVASLPATTAASSTVALDPAGMPLLDPLPTPGFPSTLIAQAPTRPTTPSSTATPTPTSTYGPHGEIVSVYEQVTGVVLTVDENTNTLIIRAPPDKLDQIKELIAQLDVVPTQVLVQAVVVDVTLSNDTKLGVEFNWENIGLHNLLGSIQSNLGVITRDDSGNPEPNLTPGFVATLSKTDFQSFLRAIQTYSRAKVLATPRIFTSNNKPAFITVATEIPYATGQSSLTTGVVTTFDRMEVGIVLQITPIISSTGMVTLAVDQKANAFLRFQDVGGGLLQPVTSSREASATITVADGETVVLGGLIQDTVSRTETRVPLLGSLPLVGWLFRDRHSVHEKSELLVFLTPHVVRSPEEARRLSQTEEQRLHTPMPHADGGAPAPEGPSG